MRSLLFVPADNERKLHKGLESGADALIIDLEDSVAPQRKAIAREMALAFLASAPARRPRLVVRLNALASGMIDADLDGVIAGAPDLVILPKADGGPSVAHLDAKIAVREALHGLPDGRIGIMPITTETGAALFTGGTYRDCSPRLAAVSWGAEDLSVDLGATANRDDDGRYLDPYRLARTLCLATAAAAGTLAIDTVSIDFKNAQALRRESLAAARDGFVGKMAIHPNQIACINEVFTPSAEAVATARALVAMFAADPSLGVVAIDGVMYDRPHVARAERLLARARDAGAG